MAKAVKENLKAIKFLQGFAKDDSSGTRLTDAHLEKVEIDISITKHQFRNIELKRVRKDYWEISLIDSDLDLDGNKFEDNPKLMNLLRSMEDEGVVTIDDLKTVNVIAYENQLSVGNIILKKNAGLFVREDRYRISKKDKEKTIDGLWVDDAITVKRVLQVLSEYDLKTSAYKKLTEVELNKELEMHFKNYFANVKKSGSSNQGQLDIILGKEQNFGIELKMARELAKSAQSDRAIGQIDRYMKQFQKNFMIVIAGTATEKREKYVEDVIQKAKSSKANLYYMETI
jgi:hypothetical protein